MTAKGPADSRRGSERKTVGIVCAMPQEVAGLVPAERRRTTDRPDFYATTIAGFEAIVASAGLGKVRAAVSASILLERWNCSALICAGTAGGLSGAQPMQVIVARDLIQHDYGRSIGRGSIELYRPGVPPLPQYRDVDPSLAMPPDSLARFQAITRDFGFVGYGRFASGDQFVNDDTTRKKLETLGAVAVDMECGAVAQVAEDFGIPWLVAKGISDEASTSSHEEFLDGIDEASRRSAAVVEALLPALLDKS